MPLLLIILAFISTSSAVPHLPQKITDWKDWAFQQHPEVHCVDRQIQNCAWQGSLKLTIASDEMLFTQSGSMDIAGWIDIPGDSDYWPINVQINGRHVPVIETNGKPTIYIEAGEFEVNGIIAWHTIPYQIQVPANAGLVQIFSDGQWASTTAEENGIVILSPKSIDESQPPPTIEVGRLWTDGNPPILITRLQLHNLSTLQQISLGTVWTEKLPLIQLDTTLPYWFADNELWISIPNGTHQITISNATQIDNALLSVPVGSNIWPEIEYWAFSHTPELRQIRVQNLTPVSFEQTHLPTEWNHLPVYKRTQTTIPTIEEIHRADPTPPRNRLSLVRTLWPKLQSDGFWIKDHIQGTLHTAQTITSNDKNVVQLQQQGHVQTIFEQNGRQVLQLTHRDVNTVTHANTNSTQIPLQDWSTHFESVTLHLKLPHEWKLLLWNGWIWTPYTTLVVLNLLIGLGLLWWTAESRLMRSVYGLGVLAGSLFAPISTLIFQLFKGLSSSITALRSFLFILSILWVGSAIFESNPSSHMIHESNDIVEQERSKRSRDYYTQKSDHNFGIQLGTGLPTWDGQQITKRWSNTNTQDIPMSIWVLHSTEQRFLALIAGICFLFGAWRYSLIQHLLLILGIVYASHNPAYAEEVDPTEPIATSHTGVLTDAELELLLDAYHPEICMGDSCASIALSTIKLNESTQQMTIWMEIHAIEDAIMVFPGPLVQWKPDTIQLEERDMLAIRRNNEGYLEGRIPKGVWSLEMTGPIDDSLSLYWPHKPHTLHIAETERTIQGLNSTGQLTSALRIIKRTETAQSTQGIQPHIVWERSFVLGSTWTIHNTIHLQSSSKLNASTIHLPTLDGETPETNSVLMENEHWVVPINGTTEELRWSSQIPIANQLILEYPSHLLESMALGLEWSVTCDPQYNCSFSKLSPTTHISNSGKAAPTWIPYPDETLEVSVQSLTPSAGEHVQISNTSLYVHERSGTLTYTLKMTLESSQSTEIPIQLPEGSEIMAYSVNNQQRHFKQQPQITLFSDIGEQEFVLQWSLAKPELDTIRPMPIIQGTLANPQVQYSVDNRHIVWSNTLWSQSPPSSLLWLVIAGLLGLSLARHPKNKLSFQAWLFVLIGAGHTTPWLWLPLIAALICRHFIQQQFVSIFGGIVGLAILFASPLSLFWSHKSLWIWNTTNLRWYTDVANEIPPLKLLTIPSWTLNGLWSIWWLWMLWMLGAPLLFELTNMVKKLWTEAKQR